MPRLRRFTLPMGTHFTLFVIPAFAGDDGLNALNPAPTPADGDRNETVLELPTCECVVAVLLAPLIA